MKSGLTDEGDTVAAIEHYLEVIKTADSVIDMGPAGGDGARRERLKTWGG